MEKQQRDFKKSGSIAFPLLLLLLVPGLFGSCSMLAPIEDGDGETMSTLQFFLTGKLSSVLLAADDQGDAAINQFGLTSNGTAYDVAISSSSITFQLVEADLAHARLTTLDRMASRVGDFFDSSLHAHGQSTANIAISQSYTTGQNITLSGFHTANTTILTGSAYQAPPFIFPMIRPGTLALLKWHISELRLSGTITNGVTPRAFDLTLPIFDAELIPTCQTSVTIGSQSSMYTIFRMHNLFKDTTDPTNGHILNVIYTAGGGAINATTNSALTTVILSNAGKSFLFYGCTEN